MTLRSSSAISHKCRSWLMISKRDIILDTSEVGRTSKFQPLAHQKRLCSRSFTTMHANASSGTAKSGYARVLSRPCTQMHYMAQQKAAMFSFFSQPYTQMHYHSKKRLSQPCTLNVLSYMSVCSDQRFGNRRVSQSTERGKSVGKCLHNIYS